jgi:hypothetical protein
MPAVSVIPIKLAMRTTIDVQELADMRERGGNRREEGGEEGRGG